MPAVGTQPLRSQAFQFTLGVPVDSSVLIASAVFVADLNGDGDLDLLTYALESANARIQKMIKQVLHLDRLRDAMHYTAERGVMFDVFCMTGFPSETFDEAKETVDFLNVFPGTEIHDQVQEMEGLGGTEAFSTGYQGHGMDPPHVDVTRNDFITKFMMRKNRVKQALSVQRKFLTDDELLIKYKSYCGKNFKLDSADDIENRLAVY